VTRKELPFAQISIQNSSFGTAANDEGRFILSIPPGFEGDTLQVAYLGYHTLKFRIPAVSDTCMKVPLSPMTLQLAEVEVIALTPQEVIRRVVAHIPGNYGKDSLLLTAFIRTQKIYNGKLAEYTEAIIEDLKTGYSLYKPGHEKDRMSRSNIPNLLKGRVISDTNLVNSIGDPGKNAGCLGCNFIHDFAEFYHNTVLDESFFKYYSFRMEERFAPEGGRIYHIWFDQKKGVGKTLWKGEMFINGSDFALLLITQRPSFEAYEQFEKEKYRRQFTIRNTPGWLEEMPLLEMTTTYNARNGKYYLSTIRIANWMTFNNPATGQQVRFAYRNDVVVTDATRDPERIKSFKGDRSVGVSQRWDQIVAKGDEKFWAGYNYIPVEEKLVESIKEIAR